MNEKDAEMCVETCATFKQASESAKHFARQYHCEVAVGFRSTRNCWEVIITGKDISIYSEQERLARERAFDKSCEPDPNYGTVSEREELIDAAYARHLNEWPYDDDETNQ